MWFIGQLTLKCWIWILTNSSVFDYTIDSMSLHITNFAKHERQDLRLKLTIPYNIILDEKKQKTKTEKWITRMSYLLVQLFTRQFQCFIYSAGYSIPQLPPLQMLLSLAASRRSGILMLKEGIPTSPKQNPCPSRKPLFLEIRDNGWTVC